MSVKIEMTFFYPDSNDNFTKSFYGETISDADNKWIEFMDNIKIPMDIQRLITVNCDNNDCNLTQNVIACLNEKSNRS
jgi:hypothetical protein